MRAVHNLTWCIVMSVSNPTNDELSAPNVEPEDAPAPTQRERVRRKIFENMGRFLAWKPDEWIPLISLPKKGFAKKRKRKFEDLTRAASRIEIFYDADQGTITHPMGTFPLEELKLTSVALQQLEELGKGQHRICASVWPTWETCLPEGIEPSLEDFMLTQPVLKRMTPWEHTNSSAIGLVIVSGMLPTRIADDLRVGTGMRREED